MNLLKPLATAVFSFYQAVLPFLVLTFYKNRYRNRTIDFQTKSDTILEYRKVLLTFTKKIYKKTQKLKLYIQSLLYTVILHKVTF